jgi:precorrin-6B methylase 1
MPDFPIRMDLVKLGLPERTIRVLEKAALIVDTIERVTGTETSLDTVNDQLETIDEALEDANLSLESLDDRLDEQEAGNGPYVKKTGDVMSGALNVNALLECDTFKLNVAPSVSAATASTHKVAIDVNGSTYYILLSNV